MLADVGTLRALLAAGTVDLLDCRFRLDDPDWGRATHREGHLPGAVYAHLDEDLSDLSRPGLGRHPLPHAASLHRWLNRQGLRRDRSVVAYDDAGGRIAARAWWLLRHAGHRDVRLLDGGIGAWRAAGLPLETGARPRAATDQEWSFGHMPAIDSAALAAAMTGPAAPLLVDARAGERFRGEHEPLDPVAGHVPGAVSHPVEGNLDGERFKAPGELASRWRSLLADRPPAVVVHMCGSGVTACLNLFAMELVGLRGSALYGPSWSGWLADPSRPVATGE